MSAIWRSSSPVSEKRYRGCSGSCLILSALRRSKSWRLGFMEAPLRLPVDLFESCLLARPAAITQPSQQYSATRGGIGGQFGFDEGADLIVTHAAAVVAVQGRGLVNQFPK